MRLHIWTSAFSHLAFTLLGAALLSGCHPEQSSEPRKPPQDQGNTAPAPVNKQVGEASWYGPGFHGKETANGETFNQEGMTAAHPTLPMGTKAEVTNLENGKKAKVTINDRGPYADGRAIDLSSGAAKKLDMKKGGTTKVKIETKRSKKKPSRTSQAKPPRVR